MTDDLREPFLDRDDDDRSVSSRSSSRRAASEPEQNAREQKRWQRHGVGMRRTGTRLGQVQHFFVLSHHNCGNLPFIDPRFGPRV